MQASSINIEPYLPILFLALCVVMMVFICYLISLISGWFSLSERFRLQSEPCGETKGAGPFFYTVYMRFWGHYSSIIRITAAEDALYLSVILPFRIGHPPLRISWKEIQFGRTKFLWRRYVVLTLGEQERIPMRISESMARKLGILERIPN